MKLKNDDIIFSEDELSLILRSLRVYSSSLRGLVHSRKLVNSEAERTYKDVFSLWTKLNLLLKKGK